MEKNMRVVFTGKSQVALEEAPMPEVKKDQVLVKTLVTQISTGTELTMLEANVEPGSPWLNDIKYPMYPGYSNVGEVIAVGEGVDESYIGKRILTLCKHAKYDTISVGNNYPWGDNYSWIPDGVENDEAAFSVIAQITLASIRVAQIKPGENAVVFGAGLIGQLVARHAMVAGALNVIVIDVSDERLDLVPKNDSFVTYNSKGKELKEIADFIRGICDGRLADIVFETTGFQGLLDTELRCIAKNGKLIVTSSPKGDSTVNFDYCSRNGITIISAHNFAKHTNCDNGLDRWTRRADSEYYMQLVKKGLVSVKNMITHRANYKDAVKMYEMLMADRSKALAVHLDWED